MSAMDRENVNGESQENRLLTRALSREDVAPDMVERQWRRLQGQIRSNAPRSRFLGNPFVHAAAAALFVMATVFLGGSRSELEVEEGKIRGEVAFGSKLVAEEETRLRISGHVSVELAKGTEMTARSFESISLHRGAVWCDVVPGTPFEVETPVANVQVKGTKFWVGLKEDDMGRASLAGLGIMVAVMSGTVTVLDLHGARHDLTAGEAWVGRGAGEGERISLQEELSFLEAEVSALEDSLEEARRKETQASVARAKKEQFDRAFAELTVDLSDEIRAFLKMLYRRPEAAENLFRLTNAAQSKTIADRAAKALELEAGRRAEFRKGVARHAGEMAAIEVRLMVKYLRTDFGGADAEEVFKRIRDEMRVEQARALVNFQKEIESSFGTEAWQELQRWGDTPALMAYYALNPYGQSGWEETELGRQIISSLGPWSVNAWDFLSETMTPSELDAWGTEMKIWIQTRGGADREKLLSNLESYLDRKHIHAEMAVKVTRILEALQ